MAVGPEKLKLILEMQEGVLKNLNHEQRIRTLESSIALYERDGHTDVANAIRALQSAPVAVVPAQRVKEALAATLAETPEIPGEGQGRWANGVRNAVSAIAQRLGVDLDATGAERPELRTRSASPVAALGAHPRATDWHYPDCPDGCLVLHQRAEGVDAQAAVTSAPTCSTYGCEQPPGHAGECDPLG